MERLLDLCGCKRIGSCSGTRESLDIHIGSSQLAKIVLVNEVPLETVSFLLGHRKLAITEKHHARFVAERQALIESQVRKSWARIGHVKK